MSSARAFESCARLARRLPHHPRRGDIDRIDDHHSVARRAQDWRLRFSPIAKQRMEKMRRRRWAMIAAPMRMQRRKCNDANAVT